MLKGQSKPKLTPIQEQRNKKIKEKIGDRIAGALDERKLRKEDLYNEMENEYGVKAETIKKWESGRSMPNAIGLYYLSKVLDCDMEYLMGEQTDMRKDIDMLSEKTGLQYGTMEKLYNVTTKYPNLKPIINNFLFTVTDDNEKLREFDDDYGYNGYSNFKGASGLLNKIHDLIMLDLPCEAEFEYSILKDSNINIAGKIPDLQAPEIYNMFFSRIINSLDLFILLQREKMNYQDDPMQAKLDKLREEATDRHMKHFENYKI